MATDVTTNTDLARAHGADVHQWATNKTIEMTESELDNYTRAAIQQAAVREAERIDLTRLYKMAAVHASIAASPHHMTFTVEALRNLIEEFASPAPPKQPPAFGGGECGGVPLSDEQISELIHAKHFARGYVLRNSDLVCLDWYRLGLRDGEAAHGISPAPLQGKEAGV